MCKVRSPAGKRAAAGGEEDDYEDDFEEGELRAANAPLPPITSPDFEQKDLTELCALLESCLATLAQVSRRGCGIVAWVTFRCSLTPPLALPPRRTCVCSAAGDAGRT